MDSNDLPIISLPTESTRVDTSAAVPAMTKPASEIRKAAPPAEVRKAPPPIAAAARPAAPPAGRVAPPTVSMPSAPKPPPSATVEDEDPERLLREYAERQKTKVVRLEQQLGESRKVAAERDAFRSSNENLARELGDARRQLEAAAKFDDVIRDLQGKLDAALLNNSMLGEEKARLKAGLGEMLAKHKTLEEKAAQTEKALAEAQKSLAAQGEARRGAEARVAAALHALQGEAAKKVPAVPAVPPPAPRK